MLCIILSEEILLIDQKSLHILLQEAANVWEGDLIIEIYMYLNILFLNYQKTPKKIVFFC